MELRGKRYHHRHYLSHYRLFESTPLTNQQAERRSDQRLKHATDRHSALHIP
jgi:hypothetical protein